MSVKHFLMKTVSDVPFLRHCVIRTQNKLRLNGNAFDVSDIHFQKNLVEMQESEQSFSLESGSFMKNCIVRMSDKHFLSVEMIIELLLAGIAGWTWSASSFGDTVIRSWSGMTVLRFLQSCILKETEIQFKSEMARRCTAEAATLSI